MRRLRGDDPRAKEQHMNRLICDNHLLDRIHANLEGFEIEPRPDSGAKRAAVAVTVVEAAFGADVYGLPCHGTWQPDAALILTKRAAGLKNHSGQWALPGGRMEEGETPETAALRELEEEVGLELDPGAVMGRLDDFVTRSGFAITPVVVWGGRAGTLTANPTEVASIHRIPVAEFMRRDAPILWPLPEGNDRPVLLMPVGDNWIAAPTAAMLYQFREVAILGKPTRVAHFDQPQFAWR
jgi:8-oxo-dGTP pyrophosphatase MutT (NUDIX family)